MGHSVFISYRRKGGEMSAQMFYMLLGQRGYRVFYDIESLGQGLFDEKILREIEEAEVFLVILSEGALDRCVNDGDWVRREIAHAIKLGKPIVPILFRGFEFPAQMPQDIAKLARYNGVDFSDMNFFDARTEALIKRIDAAAEEAKAKAVTIPENAVYTRRGQPGLVNVVIPEGVTEIEDEAFKGCESLQSVLIPDGVKRIGASAFEGCSGLTEVVIPDSVMSIGAGAFIDCSDLTSVVLSNNITSIKVQTFFKCTALTNVIIPDSVTSIEDCAFDFCIRLKSVNIPNSVTNIGGQVFMHCEGLTNMSIPDGITCIKPWLFRNCRRLTRVEIPGSVTSIEESAFSCCERLKTIQFGGTKAQWEAIKKGDYWNEFIPKYIVCCEDGTIEK